MVISFELTALWTMVLRKEHELVRSRPDLVVSTATARIIKTPYSFVYQYFNILMHRCTTVQTKQITENVKNITIKHFHGRNLNLAATGVCP